MLLQRSPSDGPSVRIFLELLVKTVTYKLTDDTQHQDHCGWSNAITHKECADVKVRAQDIWERSADIVGDHKYLQLKEVRAHGARVYQGKPLIDGTSCYGALVVPIQDSAGDVCQLQLIMARQSS